MGVASSKRAPKGARTATGATLSGAGDAAAADVMLELAEGTTTGTVTLFRVPPTRGGRLTAGGEMSAAGRNEGGGEMVGAGAGAGAEDSDDKKANAAEEEEVLVLLAPTGAEKGAG